MTDFEPLLTEADVGIMLHLEPRAVQHLARTGKLPAKKVGRYWRFRRSWIERWLDGKDCDEATAVSARPPVAAQRKTN